MCEIRSHLLSMSLTPAPWAALLLCPAGHAGVTQVLMRSWAITELRGAKSSPLWKRKGKPSHQQGHQYKILQRGGESWLSLRLPLWRRDKASSRECAASLPSKRAKRLDLFCPAGTVSACWWIPTRVTWEGGLDGRNCRNAKAANKRNRFHYVFTAYHISPQELNQL